MFDVLFPLAAALPITALLLPVPASRTVRRVGLHVGGRAVPPCPPLPCLAASPVR